MAAVLTSLDTLSRHRYFPDTNLTSIVQRSYRSVRQHPGPLMMTFSLVVVTVGIAFSLWGLWAMERTANPAYPTGFLRLTLGSNVLVLGAVSEVVAIFG